MWITSITTTMIFPSVIVVYALIDVMCGSTISNSSPGNNTSAVNSTLPVSTVATNDNVAVKTNMALVGNSSSARGFTEAMSATKVALRSRATSTTQANDSSSLVNTTPSVNASHDMNTTQANDSSSLVNSTSASLNITDVINKSLGDTTVVTDTVPPTHKDSSSKTTKLPDTVSNFSDKHPTVNNTSTVNSSSVVNRTSTINSTSSIETATASTGTVRENSATVPQGTKKSNLGTPSPMPVTRRERPGMRPHHENVSSEQRLMADLLWKYESSVRPVYNSSKSVVVGLGLTLTQILDLDEKNQVLTTNVWLEVEWKDEKLSWDTDKYEGTESLRIPCRQIWLPDIVLYNSVDDYTSGYMPSLAMVYSNGRVFWGPVVRFRSSCKIDITYFPFDDQVCYLKLGSWAYNGFQVDATKRSNTIDLSNYIDNGEWELIGIKVTRNSVYYNCCKEPFPDVMFYMRLRRRVKYYFMNIIIPCIILSFLCLAGFLLPPESGEKITLGLSVLLTITVFMLMVADKMPQTSESISLISIYLMVVLSMSCLSILFSVGILSIHHQRGKPRRCPEIIKYIVFSIVAPVLCLKIRSSGHVLKRNSVRGKPNRPKRSFPDKPEIIQLDGRRDFNEFEEEFETFMTDQSIPEFDLDLKTFQEKQNSVNELIQWLHRKHKTETIDDLSFQEWRDVAFVLDRLLFVLFLVVTVISTFAILSMRPEQMLTGFTDVHVDR